MNRFRSLRWQLVLGTAAWTAGLVVIVGAIYYVVSRQTAREDVVPADVATGEATIG